MKFYFDTEPAIVLPKLNRACSEEEEAAAQKFLETIEVKQHELIGQKCKIKFSSTGTNDATIINVYQKDDRTVVRIQFLNDGSKVFAPIQNVELI